MVGPDAKSEPSPLRLVGVTAGEPFDPLARSGTNLHLFTTLREAGVLAGAVNARPAWLARLERLGAWSPNRELRRQRGDASASRTSPLARRLMSSLGRRRAARVDPEPDVAFQIGAWYDLSGSPSFRPRLRCSFHDGNLAAFLSREDLGIDRESPSVRRALAFEQRVYEGLDLVLPRSEWLRRFFIEDFGVPEDRVVAVGAGANFDAPPELPERDFGSPRLLFVGKDWERKGGPEVVAAFEALRRERSDAELWIVGPPKRPSLPSGAHYVEPLRRDSPADEAALRELYAKATAFVMPSRFEPWGIAVLEAMAFGLPCVVSDRCALPEMVLDGRTGHVARTTAELTEALRDLADDPQRARAWGEVGRSRYLERFTWDSVVARILGECRRRLKSEA